MIGIEDHTTIGAAFRRAVDAYGSRDFLAVPANTARAYHRHGFSMDFAAAGRGVERLTAIYRSRGIGLGHRVAMLLENRPEHFLHKLALNTLGASCVPINPGLPGRRDRVSAGALQSRSGAGRGRPPAQLRSRDERERASLPGRTICDELSACRAAAPRRATSRSRAASEASVLYTSGTTGRPKGCMLSHGYELASRRLVRDARRPRGVPAGGRAHLQSAAGLSLQFVGRVVLSARC